MIALALALSQSKMVSEEPSYSAYSGLFFTLPCLCFTVLKVCHKLYTKYRYKLEPVYIFLTNYFVGILLKLSSNLLSSAQMLFFPASKICWNYAAGLFFSSYLSLSIIAMQTDRFLAIKWNICYEGKVDNGKSFMAIGACIIVALLSVSILILVDKDFLICSADWRITTTRTTGLVFVESVNTVAVVMTIGVLYYSVKTSRRLAKVLPAPVNLPTIEEVSVKRLEGHSDVFVRATESRAIQMLPLEASRNCFGESAPTPVEKVSEEEASGSHAAQLDEQRKQYATKSFDKEKGVEMGHSCLESEQPREPNSESEETPMAKFLAMLKNTAMTNMFNMIFLINFPVTTTVGIIFWNCEESSEGCADYLLIRTVLDWPRFVGFITMCYLVHRGLSRKPAQPSSA